MNAESWVRLSRLLDEALDLSPSERVPWLAALGPDDEALKPRLLALLAHAPSVQAADFLGTLPNVDVGAIDLPGDAADQAGATVGPYTLLRELGEGGMGTVWLAHRTDGIVQRAVALKLPRGAWPRADLVQRMARERDILAALAHPHIARLYDAGVTPGGRPYLALEYVEGRPIDDYCEDRGLDVHARVRAFLQVVEAVAYAHGKLVVHRDVKPSNILVTGDGQVRLLDFGIAKLLDEANGQQTMLSELAGRPLTPEYASPEQIAGEPLGVASDVYSLGVVLYELLTGARPHRPHRSSRRALEDAIVHTDPFPPSASTTEPSRRRVLRGDLDTIILKALKKKPDERYSTVNAFGDDLQRYLEGRPVLARPDSRSYRASKFVRRNKVAVAAAAAIVVSVTVFAGVSAWQARVLAEQRRVAQIERDTSEQVVRVLIDLFQTTNPSVRPDGDRIPIGEFLAGAQTRSLELLRGAPAVRAKLQQVFGLIHHSRGQYAPARVALEEALGEQRRLAGPDSPGALESLQALGELINLAGDRQRARTVLEESLERHRRVYGEQHERTARVLAAMAPIVAEDNIEEAGALLRRSLEIRRATLGPHHPDVGSTLGSLAGYYTRRQDYDRAKDFYRQALAVFPTPLERRNPIAITILNDFASLLGLLNAREESEALQREALELGRQVLGPETLTVANLVNNLGTTQAFMGRHADAERSFRASFETHRSLLGENHWRTSNAARNVGRVLALQRRYVEALPWMDRALAASADGDAAKSPGRWAMLAQRAQVLFRLGRRDEALSEATAAVESLQRLTADDREWPLALARVLLGRMLIETGRPHEAEAALTAALDEFTRLGNTHPQRAEASCELGRARVLQGDRAGGVQRLEECLPILSDLGPRGTRGRDLPRRPSDREGPGPRRSITITACSWAARSRWPLPLPASRCGFPLPGSRFSDPGTTG